jgi:LPS export ABC transporter protein LptC
MINKLPHNIFLQAAFIWSCLFVYGCENDPQDIRNNSSSRSMVEEVTGVQSLISQNGVPRALLKAPYMLRYSADTSFLEFPKSLHVQFFDGSGKVESQLDAKYGKYYESRSTVYLRDSVIVFNNSGDTLRSPDLWWDQNTKRFYTDKQVSVKTKSKQIFGGKGLEADQDLTRWTIFQPTGFVIVPDNMKAQ